MSLRYIIAGSVAAAGARHITPSIPPSLFRSFVLSLPATSLASSRASLITHPPFLYYLLRIPLPTMLLFVVIGSDILPTLHDGDRRLLRPGKITTHTRARARTRTHLLNADIPLTSHPFTFLVHTNRDTNLHTKYYEVYYSRVPTHTKK